MNYKRQSESGTSVSSIIPISSPLVTNGELDESIFVSEEEYKYVNGTLLQANESSWTPNYTTVTGVPFVPDYNDEDLFEHIYTVPAGDISTYQYSWRKPFTVTFSETYQSDPGNPPTIPPTYSERTATRDIAVSFRTELAGLEITASDWGESKYYYSDTYSNSVIIEANDSLKIGDTLNGNTVTEIVKGKLYYHVTFTGSNGFVNGLYGDINVLCGLGIKNKFGILGWFFTDFKKIKIVPDFQIKLENEFTKFLGNLNQFDLNPDKVESLYEGCFTEVGASTLRTIVEDIYQPAKLLNNNISFSTFDNIYVTDGITDNYISVTGSGNVNENFITLTENLNLPVTFRDEYILSVSEDNLTITNIVGNVIYLSGTLRTTFKNKRLNIVKNIILTKFRDIPPSSERLKYNFNDFQVLDNDEQYLLNRKNYPSIFEDFDNNVGKFTVKYNWTLLDSKEPGLIDVNDTLTTDINLGSLWDYPSTDVDGKFYIEGSSNEQYRINVSVSEVGGFVDAINLSGGVYTSTSITQLFGDTAYETEDFVNGAGETATESYFDYKTNHFIPFNYNIGTVTTKLGDIARNGRLYNELSCNLVENLYKNQDIIKVDTTEGFKDSGWLLIPKYTVYEAQFREYSYLDWEIIYYKSKTSNTFIVGKRGSFNTTIYDFELYDLDKEELNTIPIVQFEGYGGINE